MRFDTLTDVVLAAWFFVLAALNYIYAITVLTQYVPYEVAVLSAQLTLYILLALYIPMHVFTGLYLRRFLYQWLPKGESKLLALPRAILALAVMSLPWFFLVVGVDYYTLYIMFVVAGILAILSAGGKTGFGGVDLGVATLAVAVSLAVAYFGFSPIFLLIISIYLTASILLAEEGLKSWRGWLALMAVSSVLLASFGMWYWAGKWMLSFNVAHFAVGAGQETPVRKILTDCYVCQPIGAFTNLPATETAERALMVGPFAPYMDFHGVAQAVSSALFGGLFEWFTLPIFFFAMILVAAFPEELGFRAPMLHGGARELLYAFAMAHIPSRFLIVVSLLVQDPALEYITIDPVQGTMVLAYYMLLGVAIMVVISTAGFFITLSFLRGNIWVAMAVHALYNAAISAFYESEFDYLIFTVIAALAAVVLLSPRGAKAARAALGW